MIYSVDLRGTKFSKVVYTAVARARLDPRNEFTAAPGTATAAPAYFYNKDHFT